MARPAVDQYQQLGREPIVEAAGGDGPDAGPDLRHVQSRHHTQRVGQRSVSSATDVLLCDDVDGSRRVPQRLGHTRHGGDGYRHQSLEIDVRQIPFPVGVFRRAFLAGDAEATRHDEYEEAQDRSTRQRDGIPTSLRIGEHGRPSFARRTRMVRSYH